MRFQISTNVKLTFVRMGQHVRTRMVVTRVLVFQHLQTRTAQQVNKFNWRSCYFYRQEVKTDRVVELLTFYRTQAQS